MIYAGSVLIAELTDVLAEEPGVVLAVLIGSRARGDADEHEDVDLLLELDPPGDEVMLALRERLVAVTGVDVDPRTTRSAAYSRHFWNKAVGEGRPLVDRKQQWPSIKADPEAARRGARRPVEDLSSGERETVKWMREQEWEDDTIEELQERDGGSDS